MDLQTRGWHPVRWHTTGLAGTGNHDFVVEEVFGPFAESWSFAQRPHCSGTLYRFPPLFLVSYDCCHYAGQPCFRVVSFS
jgi:hypothetical protein